MITSRRSFLTGFAATLFVAPAIVRVSSIMPVKQMFDPYRDLNLAPAVGPEDYAQLLARLEERGLLSDWHYEKRFGGGIEQRWVSQGSSQILVRVA